MIFSLTLLLAASLVSAETSSADDLAKQFSLTTSTSYAFPTATLSSQPASAHIISNWHLYKDKITNGSDRIAFVNDPFPNSSVGNGSSTKGPVLRVTYPADSFSHDTGGAQMYSLFGGNKLQSMLLSYEIAFDSNFNWVKGGKLPGIRGGNPGCSGGRESNGKDCFTSRMMFRTGGAGEAYLYIPTSDAFCGEQDVICNSDFGTSVSRGSFKWVSGEWNRLTLLVQLNDPPQAENGKIRVYHNDQLAFSKDNLPWRTTSNLTAGGLYISTFFGGDDNTWATPTEQHSYFRNFRLWGSTQAQPQAATSNTTTEKKSQGTRQWSSDLTWLCYSLAFTVALFGSSGHVWF